MRISSGGPAPQPRRGPKPALSAAAPSSAPEAQLLAALGTVLRDHGADYPHLAAATASSARSGTQGQDQALEFGLDRILDGLEVLIAERARS
ncbi:TetR/AcrR family transcriptional regulator C-terminal domain-containing protein [Streptomyces sp. NPDC051020]|uniref:TetR/AcrR family transcriptional regulator C-terminal domain-containing protein n=1 Tax=Streptomyces sp. NPDC051020 TaxID=3155409 RepID=UPI003439E8AB